MTRKPIEMMLDGIAWRALGPDDPKAQHMDGLPHATHEGVLDLPFGGTLRCYQLSTGERVFDADDVAFMLGVEVVK